FKVKQSDPRGHLTASQALSVPRDYILEEAAGLLKGRWPNKIKVSLGNKTSYKNKRKSEKEPSCWNSFKYVKYNNANTTSAFGTAMPGENFMADMIGQNFLLNQPMNQILNQAIKATLGAASATPDIFNVQKLELPKHGENEKGKSRQQLRVLAFAISLVSYLWMGDQLCDLLANPSHEFLIRLMCQGLY
ncbi:unnamed protein product, partial [Enterobius vermicularis]|uniref:Vesicle transport protein n=1 Tax=Enterobius vermicularis TaxID=51028 RepID=A0A0N4VKB8_ENTVE